MKMPMAIVLNVGALTKSAVRLISDRLGSASFMAPVWQGGGQMLRLLAVIVIAVFMSVTGTVAAQQPGTADYNRRSLPAQGAGGTRGVQVWGAVAKGQGEAIGWVTDAATEEEAVNRAMKQCNFDPARPCDLLSTFVNSCAVLVANKQFSEYSSGGTGSLASHRRSAMKSCGSDCVIHREGCAGRQR